MKQTSPGLLVTLALFGTLGGFGLQTGLAAAGMSKVRPEYTLTLSLALIAAVILALAVPVRRAVRGANRHPIDPFYATRVVVLAKACSIAGALLAGVAIGFVIELVFRGAPTSDALLRILAGLGGSILVLVAGLVAEYLCRVPPHDDDDDRNHPGGGTERVRP